MEDQIISVDQPTPSPENWQPSGDEHKKKMIIFVIIIAGILIATLILFFALRKRITTDRPDQPAQPVITIDPTLLEEFEHDKDGDGLSDEQEAELGTSDLEFDTDGDGISDIQEVNVWQTDPNNPDTDGDGFADGYEVIKGFSPTDAPE